MITVYVYENSIKMLLDGKLLTRSGNYATYDSNGKNYSFYIDEEIVFETPCQCTVIICE